MRKIFSEFKIAHLSKSVLKLTEPLGKWQKKKLVANPSLEKFWLFQRWSLLMMESEEEWDHAIFFFPSWKIIATNLYERPAEHA